MNMGVVYWWNARRRRPVEEHDEDNEPLIDGDDDIDSDSDRQCNMKLAMSITDAGTDVPLCAHLKYWITVSRH